MTDEELFEQFKSNKDEFYGYQRMKEICYNHWLKDTIEFEFRYLIEGDEDAIAVEHREVFKLGDFPNQIDCVEDIFEKIKESVYAAIKNQNEIYKEVETIVKGRSILDE